MKTVINTVSFVFVCLSCSCTTHVHPEKTRTVYQKTPTYTAPVTARIAVDTPDTTEVVRPEE